MELCTLLWCLLWWMSVVLGSLCAMAWSSIAKGPEDDGVAGMQLLGEQEEQANAVRREGIDSALLKYAEMAMYDSSSGDGDHEKRQTMTKKSEGVAYEVPLPPSLRGIDAQVMRLQTETLLTQTFSIREFSLPPASIATSGLFYPVSLLRHSPLITSSAFADPDAPAAAADSYSASDRSSTTTSTIPSASVPNPEPISHRSPVSSNHHIRSPAVPSNSTSPVSFDTSPFNSTSPPVSSVPSPSAPPKPTSPVSPDRSPSDPPKPTSPVSSNHSPAAPPSPPPTSVIFVYRRITNFTVYTLPPPYSFLSPIIGIISSSPLSFSASINITMPFAPGIQSSSLAQSALCASFSTSGSISISNLTSSNPNTCSSSSLGDFALVALIRPPVAPSLASPIASAPLLLARRHSLKFIVATTCLSLGSVAFVVGVVLGGFKILHDLTHTVYVRKAHDMDAEEASPRASSRLPMASATVRTKPALEVLHFQLSVVPSS